jgi:hypothetical protein
MDDSADLERVSEMADVLAERIFASVQKGELTVSDSPEARLLLQAAKMLETAGIDFPPGVRRLAKLVVGHAQD